MTTALFVRRDQLREGAIVLSHMPDATTVPFVVLDPPPATQRAYAKLYETYRTIADAREDRQAMDSAAVALTPYRQWAKHQAYVARLLARTNVDRAIFLFEPGPEDLAYVDPLPMSRLSDRQYAIVPPEARRETLAFASLADLEEKARARFAPSATATGAVLAPADESVASYLVALHRALLDRRSDARAPTEFVLVECADDAERVLGVQYAIVKNAAFGVCPEPDGRATEAARSAIEARSNAPIAAATANAGQSSAEAVAALRAALFGDTSAPLLKALETATSAALPSDVVRAVGDLPLTVLTRSTSYNFFSRDAISWAEKPIGHVTGDTTLLLFDELFPGEPISEVGLNVVVDPQFITTDETAAVMGDLAHAGSYPLALRGPAAGSTTLGHLATTIAVDLLFFNTHGSDNGILLADMPIPQPAFKILQRVTLRNRPLVFNNSCLSWVAVGREFIQIGARAYVGTLWSVHETEAAVFASGAIARMLAGEPPAAAVRRSGVKAVDSRAYIFVGTASALFTRTRTHRALDADGRRLRIASLMLHSAETLLAMPTIDIFQPTIVAYVTLLVAQSEALLAECDRAQPAPNAERIDDAAMQMRIYVRLQMLDPTADRPIAFFNAWYPKLAAVSGAELLRPRALFFLATAALYDRMGNWRQALPLLEQSVRDAKNCGDPPALQYLALARFFAAGGRFDEAFEHASLAVDSLGGQFEPIAVEYYHVLAGIALGMRRAADAIKLAGLGFTQADARDDLRGRAIAKCDESASSLANEDASSALTSATEALRLARLTYDSELVTDASDELARALVANERVPEAKSIVERELAITRERRRWVAVASLLEIAGDIALHEGDAQSAIASWQQSITNALLVGRPAFELRVLSKLRARALASGTPRAIFTLLLLQIAMIDDVDEPLRARIAADFTNVFDQVVGSVDPAIVRALQSAAHELVPLPTVPVSDERASMVARIDAACAQIGAKAT